MKFQLSSGNAMSARQAWHDAFVTDIKAIDYVEIANGSGVQYTAKGSDNCTMNHCDKGKIQQAVSNLKSHNLIAWAWGMWSYAPDGTENANTLINILFKFAMGRANDKHLEAIGKKSAFESMQCGKLARIALEHAKVEANTDKRKPHNHAEMAQLLRVTPDQYEKLYHRIFIAMKDALRDLSGEALPPVAVVVWAIIDKEPWYAGEAVEDYARLMKTDKRVAA